MKTISQSIREAALTWPVGFVGCVESQILNFGFQSIMEDSVQVLFARGDYEHAICYMLFVAESLE